MPTKEDYVKQICYCMNKPYKAAYSPAKGNIKKDFCVDICSLLPENIKFSKFTGINHWTANILYPYYKQKFGKCIADKSFTSVGSYKKAKPTNIGYSKLFLIFKDLHSNSIPLERESMLPPTEQNDELEHKYELEHKNTNMDEVEDIIPMRQETTTDYCMDSIYSVLISKQKKYINTRILDYLIRNNDIAGITYTDSPLLQTTTALMERFPNIKKQIYEWNTKSFHQISSKVNPDEIGVYYTDISNALDTCYTRDKRYMLYIDVYYTTDISDICQSAITKGFKGLLLLCQSVPHNFEEKMSKNSYIDNMNRGNNGVCEPIMFDMFTDCGRFDLERLSNNRGECTAIRYKKRTGKQIFVWGYRFT